MPSDLPLIRHACAWALLLSGGIFLSTARADQENGLRLIPSVNGRPWAAASIADDTDYVLTGLVLPTVKANDDLAGSPTRQVQTTLENLRTLLKSAGSDVTRVVRLNVYVAEESAVTEVLDVLQQQWVPHEHFPPLTLVVSALPDRTAVVAVDAVATAGKVTGHPPDRAASARVARGEKWARLPSGCRLFISGQAEQGDSLQQATQATLAMLQKTLESLGRSSRDIAQLKAFVMPMADASVVEQAVAEFYAGQTPPPLVMVEWKSSANTPIEIELVASGGPARGEAPAVEHLWLEWMSRSPVYCRVARVNHGPLIFTGGLTPQPGDSDRPAGDAKNAADDGGAAGVVSVFEQLQQVLQQSGSDLKHLVKATYYVSRDEESKRLNELRPRFYHPDHPPAASKAVVHSVGSAAAGLAIDLIAVPVQR